MTGRIKPRADRGAPAVLTGLQEAELLEYLNWGDGDMGLRSSLAQMVQKMADGVWRGKTYLAHNPEAGMIQRLDRIKRHRVIHRALRSIGRHARTLSHAYTLAPRPSYVTAALGQWYSGIALTIVPDVGILVDACRRALTEKHLESIRMVNDTLRESIKEYNEAVRQYLVALKLASVPLVRESNRGRDRVLQKIRTVPHECRISLRYPCECQGRVGRDVK